MTITRAFGLTFDTQTGAVERWAAGDPASVAEHLNAARERMQSASVPTLAQICDKLGPHAGAEVLGIVKPVQRIADLEAAQTLGAADRVILRAMEGREMTVAQIAAATRISASHVAAVMCRLVGMGSVERCGTAPRPGRGSGQNPVLWRIKP